MNETLKRIITNPYVIGGTAIGTGLIVGSVIYAKNRPKTDAEIELEKLKEKNAEAEREREHQREIEKIRAQQELDAIDAQEKAKLEAKKAEERTRQIELDIQRIREKREWEKSAPQGYWDLEIAKANAAKEKANADREYDTQREIAKLQAEAARYSADASANAVKNREYYSYLRQESANNADAMKTQALASSVAGIVSSVTGKNA